MYVSGAIASVQTLTFTLLPFPKTLFSYEIVQSMIFLFEIMSTGTAFLLLCYLVPPRYYLLANWQVNAAEILA